MKAGRASRTAELVCMGRAAAHGRSSVARFADPTALALLPEEARDVVQRFHAGSPPRNLRERLSRVVLEARSKMMVARTVAIDDAVRAHPAPQLVILGAGLDGRAWRLPELRDVVVFEVDHPDSQVEKRSRAARLAPVAPDIRFVPVDFTRDSLEAALASAGHDPTKPTLWIWEGVVMYLTRAEIEASLAVIEKRSSQGSYLIVAYASHSQLLRLLGFMVRLVGEPLRSVHSPVEMRALLSQHRFDVREDRGLPEIGAALTADVARATRSVGHLRVVTAQRHVD